MRERIALALGAAEAVRKASPDAPLSEAALEVLRQIVGDTAVRVRQTFAEAVKDCAALPRHVAIALARDFETVALPVLKHSPMLTTEDLATLVKLGTVPKQAAIAERTSLPGAVAEAIVDAGQVEAISALLENLTADLGENLTRRIDYEFGHVDFIERALALRADLPSDLASRLAWSSLPAAERASVAARERRLADAVSKPDVAIREIVKAALIGDHLFATEVIAHLSKLAEPVVAALLCDRGLVGVRAALRASRLDPSYAGILWGALAALREEGFGIDAEDRPSHARRCLMRLMTGDRGLTPAQTDELDLWLAGLAPEPARASAEVHRFTG
ncbi:MAG: DUF2336 domain-containing protein [Alphaproteobacteria bacterium]